MSYATCVGTQTSKVPTRVTLLFINYSVLPLVSRIIWIFDFHKHLYEASFVLIKIIYNSNRDYSKVKLQPLFWILKIFPKWGDLTSCSVNHRGRKIHNWRGAHIHIFVLCIINFFRNRLFLQSANTNIWICLHPNYRSSAVSAVNLMGTIVM